MSASRSHTPGLSSPTRPSTSASSSASASAAYHSSHSTSHSAPTTPVRPSTSASFSSPSQRTSSASASAAAHRPPTPGHGLRTYTPGPTPTHHTSTANAPPVPSIPARYASATPSPMRSHTSHGHHSSHSSSYSSGYSSTTAAYAPAPLVPPKPRRLSTSQAVPVPTKLGRTLSEEKADAHERWLPPSLDSSIHPSSPTHPQDNNGGGREYGGRGIVNDYEKDPRKTPRPPAG
ncbi:hypothetical protein NMY22_g20014 [Coprinellus aureogranulatus]|nr:hypothetical protein NMY22_g20014 [Coprinellus aureogranulatus]